jgi:hypothetical protein
VFMRWSTGTWLAAAVLTAACVFASESEPAIGPGATRDELIKAYGPPTGRAEFGSVEILHYPQVQVRLTNGRVERVNRKITTAPAAAQPKPAAPVSVSSASPALKKITSSPADAWLTGFDEAASDATRRNTAILCVFTTSDAAPASRQFQNEIVFHRDFVNAFRAHYVLLNADFPTRTELPPDIREQNEALRDRHEIVAYPALLILSVTGEKLAEVEISLSVPGAAFRDRLILAVMAAHALPASIAPAAAQPATAEPPPAPTSTLVAPAEITSGLLTARWLIVAALIVGTLIAGAMLFVLWVVIRKINKPVALYRGSSMASRISQAASGLPTHAEVCAWSKAILRHVTIRLAETEGYRAEEQPSGSDKELVLKRPGNPAPQIIVCCVPGSAGVIPTRRLREMVGILAADDVPAGWFIAPMGFSLDARAYAEQHNIRLIDGSRLLEQLSDLPSFALPSVLSSAA